MKLDELRQKFNLVSFIDSAAEHYGKLHHYVNTHGTLIGPNDLMIATIVLANDIILVTHNTAEISCIVRLQLED